MLDEYKSKNPENQLRHYGDVTLSRKDYYKREPSNLAYLLKKRYDWMNRYIKKGDDVLEVGCGAGFSQDFIRKDCNLTLTDFPNNPWIHKKVDAMDTKFPDSSFDVVFCSNMIHHIPYPKKFFNEMIRILKPDGFLLIQDINTSIMMRILLRVLRRGTWIFKQDIYSLEQSSTDENDLWDENCAIPSLLFDDYRKFKKHFPQLEMVYHKYSEFFIFPLSGGVTIKIKTINLPYILLTMIDKIDEILVFLMPKVFALQRRVVLNKVGR